MQEEIFRFSVVRNPQLIPKEKLKTSVIHLIDEVSEKYSVYTDFLGVKKKGEKREKYIEFATIAKPKQNGLRSELMNSRLTVFLDKLSQFIPSKYIFLDQNN